MGLGRRKLIGNSFAMLSNRLTQSIVTFILTAAIGRLLGPEALGQYLLAFSYYFIFVGIVSEGAKTLFTRELSRSPAETPAFLVSGSLLQLLLSLVGYAMLFSVVLVLPYSPEATRACLIMGLAVIPFSLSNITEAVFQAQERMHWIAISTVPIYLARLGLMIGMMTWGYGIPAICGLFVVSELLILVIEWLLILPTVQLRWRIKPDLMWQLFLACRTFVVIGGIAIISNRLQILLLSLLANETLIGIYGGIIQLMQPFWIIANSIILASFPKLSQAIDSRHKQQIGENILEILLCIALPFMVGLWFIGSDLCQWVYGAEFAEVRQPLQIAAAMLMFLPFSRALSYVTVSSGLERLNLIEVIVTTAIGSILGVFLISRYQLVGAAMTDLAINILTFCQFTFIVHRRIFPLRFRQVLYRPMIVTSLMALLFLLLQNQQLWLILLVSITVYSLLAAAVGFQSLGGHQLWVKLTVRK